METITVKDTAPPQEVPVETVMPVTEEPEAELPHSEPPPAQEEQTQAEAEHVEAQETPAEAGAEPEPATAAPTEKAGSPEQLERAETRGELQEEVSETAEPAAPPAELLGEETSPPQVQVEEPSPPPDEHPMKALLEEDLTLKQFRRGQIVEGVIVAKGENEVLIDVGAKSEGIVYGNDLSQLNEDFRSNLQVGDKVLAYVLQPESRDGHVILSLARAQQEQDWRRAEELWQSQEIFEARVAETNRGGAIIRFGQLRGFVPASQLERRNEAPKDVRAEERFAFLQDQPIQVKVIEVDRRRRRLILSERAAMKELRQREKERLLQEIQEGEVRRGRVTSITDFGAFVDLGGIDGLIHISQLAWKRVQHPSEVVQVGDEIDVYVRSVDREKGRVGLSLRRLLPKPWETVLDNYAVGQVVEGVVTKIVPFGAFVRLEDGIEGLVHISELADRRVGHPHEVVKEGDRVQARILRIDPKAKRMGLSIKQASEEAYVEVDWDVAEEDEEADTGTWESRSEIYADGAEPGPAEVTSEGEARADNPNG